MWYTQQLIHHACLIGNIQNVNKESKLPRQSLKTTDPLYRRRSTEDRGKSITLKVREQ